MPDTLNLESSGRQSILAGGNLYLYAATGDTYAASRLGQAFLDLGAGGGTPSDWSMSRTAANEVTIAAGDVLKLDTRPEGTSDTTAATTEFVGRATGNASTARPAARLSRGNNQSIPNNTWTTVDLNATADFDTDSMTTVADRITINTAGTYEIGGFAAFNASGAGTFAGARILKNGAVLITDGDIQNASKFERMVLKLTDRAVGGDYYQLQVYQSTGGSLDLQASSEPAYLSAAWVGGTGVAWGNAGCKATQVSAATHNSTGNWIAMAFDAESFDLDGMHSTSVNNSRLTVITPGVYALELMGFFNSTTAGGVRGLRMDRYNSSGTIQETLAYHEFAPGATSNNCYTVPGIAQANAGDYFQAYWYQNSGANLTAVSQAHFSAVRVGYQTNPADIGGTYVASMYAANSGSPTHTSDGGWQKVGSGGGTLTWTSEIDKRPSGVSAQVDTATNKRIDIRKTGLYRIGYCVTFSSLAAGSSYGVAAYKNGSRSASVHGAIGTTGFIQVPGSRVVSLTAGDYLELYAYHDDSASEAYWVTESGGTYLQAEYLGPA